jgi:hypothetical protein
LAAERGYSAGEIAAELSRVSEKAQERLALGDTNYATQKAEWGVEKADAPASPATKGSIDTPFLQPVLALDSHSISPPAPAAPIETAELPPDLAALIDPELGITPDMFITPSKTPVSPPEFRTKPATSPHQEAKAPTRTESPVDAERLADLEPTINEFQKHFEITGVRVATAEDRGVPYAQWKANQLNAIFARHGVLGVAGRIRAESVENGIRETNSGCRKEDGQGAF